MRTMPDPEQDPQSVNVWKLKLEELAILYAADQIDGSYGYEMKQLMSTQLDQTDSSVYRRIGQFVENGWLEPHVVPGDKAQKKPGPPVKRYKTTEFGRVILAEFLGIVDGWADSYTDPDDSHSSK